VLIFSFDYSVIESSVLRDILENNKHKRSLLNSLLPRYPHIGDPDKNSTDSKNVSTVLNINPYYPNSKIINIFSLVVLINKRKEQNYPLFCSNVNNDVIM